MLILNPTTWMCWPGWTRTNQWHRREKTTYLETRPCITVLIETRSSSFNFTIMSVLQLYM